MDVGEAAIDAVVAVGEAGVVDAEEVQDGGVEVVTVGFAFDGLIAEFVAKTVGGTGLHSCAGEPGDEGAAVVIAAGFALGEGHAAELGGPDDEGVFEHAELLEILKESGDRFVDGFGDEGEFVGDVGVVVPVF